MSVIILGFVDHLLSMFIEVTAICMNTDPNVDLKSPLNMLQLLLDTLHATLKYVSEVVRKALQVLFCSFKNQDIHLTQKGAAYVF